MNEIICGDCLAVMPTLPENSVDSIITDPPYGISFMGSQWDHGVPGVEFWQAALRVAKPGAILMAFGGTRTFHRLACAIEDAGWEMRDTMCWLYGSGFPKSLDISKAIDKEAGAEREVIGYKLSPDGRNYVIEPSASKGLSGGIIFDVGQSIAKLSITTPATDSAKLWSGYGTALKPAWEPIIVAMKPLEGTYAENAQKWGVAGLNIDGSRIGTEAVPINRLEKWSGFGQEKCPDYTQEINNKGRWPANLLLDEEAARLLDEQSGELTSGVFKKRKSGSLFLAHARDADVTGCQGGDSGGASRFFYTAKASSSERNAGVEGNNGHPTVKPVDLMRYLCRLTKTPTGGVVLDPFMGSGTTGIACVLEHRDFIGIEIDKEYAEIARKRIADMTGPLFEQVANG